MKTPFYVTLLVVAFSCDYTFAQSYRTISETKFASRISINLYQDRQEPRVAGADHLVSKPNHDGNGLDLEETGGSVVIEGKKYALDTKQSQTLRRGSAVVVAEEYEVTLSSDALNRTKALLFIRVAKSSDKPIIQLIELHLIREENKQNKSEMATPRKPSD